MVATAAIATTALALALTSCSRADDGAVNVEPPSPGTAATRACERLAKDLPASLGKGLSRRQTNPASPLVAAWGSPPAILRCGVPIDPAYQPGDQVIEIEREGAKVGWYFVERSGRTVWSTPLATVHVEILIPTKYQGADLLALLTKPVGATRVL